MFEYLEEIDISAKETVDKIIEDLVVEQGITEELKVRNQFVRVSAMEHIKHTAEELYCKEH